MGAQGLLTSRSIIGSFYAKLSQAIGASWVGKLSMLFDSDQESETYKWLGMVPAMIEWIDGRKAKGFRENGITAKNVKYEATLEVLMDEIRRDKTGQVMVRIAELATRAQAHWAKLLSTKINAGASGVCYDGQYFFDTDHSEGSSGTQDNDLSIDISALATAQHGSTTKPSAGEMSICILQAIEAMFGFKDDQGEPMNENASSFLVMVPTPLTAATVGAVKNDLLAAGERNTLQSMDGWNIEVVPNARLTWTDSFAVFRTDGDVKPFIRQEEYGVKVAAIAEGSELEFKEDKHHYGISASRTTVYGFWQHGVYVTMT